jgi:tripartite ATP-independent transporter DctP family solute receptor
MISEGGKRVKKMLTRRDFLRVAGTGLAGATLLPAAGCISSGQGGGNGEGGPTVFKVGTVLGEGEPINEHLKKLAERVKARTEGEVKIQVFIASALGSNQDTYEQALSGAPIIGHADPGYMAAYVPDLGVLNGPYLVDKPEDYNKILSSDVFAEMENKLEKKGFKVLAFNWYFGTRHIISDKEIRTPADMKGLKIRIPPNVMWKKTFEALEASPTDLEFSEAFTGLESGTVDAAEAPLSSLYTTKLYEPVKVISLTGHFKALTGMVMGKKVFDSMPSDTQQIFLEEFQRFGEEESRVAVAQDDDYRAMLEEKGVTFIEADTQAFKEATEVVYTQFPEWSPGLYEKVQSVLGQ